MSGYLVKRGEEVVGYLTDESLAEHVDGEEVVIDGMYETEEYTVEEVPNTDIL